jgi:hypothetical protein
LRGDAVLVAIWIFGDEPTADSMAFTTHDLISGTRPVTRVTPFA